MTTRAFHELSAFECVLAVADRYDVEVVVLPTRGTWRIPRGATQGPGGHYVSTRAKRVYLEHTVLDPLSVSAEFHEVVHCIVAPPREVERSFKEHHALLQFELALARVVFKHCPAQIEGVLDYQAITFLDDEKRVGDWPNRTRARWWREGLRFVHRLGLLRDQRPTWRHAQWPSTTELRAHIERCEASY